jgi:ATP-dependent DNA helicase RecG
MIEKGSKSIGLIEKYGSGIRRIVEYFAEAKLPHPKFRNISDGFMVTVFALKETNVTNVTDKVTDKVTDNQIKILPLRNGSDFEVVISSLRLNIKTNKCKTPLRKVSDFEKVISSLRLNIKTNRSAKSPTLRK